MNSKNQKKIPVLQILTRSKFYKSLKIGLNFFLRHFKNRIIYNFVKFCGYKKRYDNKFFGHSFLLLFWIRNPGWVKIRIRDPR
jgi:hypothetical protein